MTQSRCSSTGIDFLGLTQTEQISDIWRRKSGIFHIFNPLKNQRYECRMAFPAPYQGDFKKQCISPASIENLSNHTIVKYPQLKHGGLSEINPNKPTIAVGFSFHRGWHPIPLHEGRKPPCVRYSKPRCGRGQVSSHRTYNGTHARTTSV